MQNVENRDTMILLLFYRYITDFLSTYLQEFPAMQYYLYHMHTYNSVKILCIYVLIVFGLFLSGTI